MNLKIIIAALVVGLFALFFAFDLQHYFNLATLKEQKDALEQLYQNNPLAIGASFFVVYVLVAALALPAAAILTIAAGAIFGFWTGLILVSFASTIGATCAFLLTRYLFHDSVEQRFGGRLDTVNNGIEVEGALYVFSLRFVPLFPFFAVNSILALTKLRTFTFYWASQIGMLAGTAVFVNAGTQLASIENTGDILSWKLLLSFALLGMFPIIAKYTLQFVRKKSNGNAKGGKHE